MESETYYFNSIAYSITETRETHTLLKNDEQFFKDYIESNSNSLPVSIPNDENMDTGNHPSIQSNFAWNRETTKLLIHEYETCKNDFRNPRMKKINLWREIAMAFRANGHNASESLLGRKMRNMKHHYKTIVDNNRRSTTGRGRIHWEYYDSFNEIFQDDRAIQGTPVLSSLRSQPSTSSALPVVISTTKLTSRPPVVLSPPPVMECPLEIDNTPSEEVFPSTSATRPLTVSPTLQETPYSQKNRRRKIQKATEMRTLHAIRRSALEIDQERLHELRKVRIAIEEIRDIQRERNDLFKKYLDKA